MMSYHDFLLTLAQISGVIIGFANLGTTFGRSTGQEVDIGQNKLRILVITEGGLFLISMCFCPFLVFFFTSDEFIAFKGASFYALAEAVGSLAFNIARHAYFVKIFSGVSTGLFSFAGVAVCLPLSFCAFFGLSLQKLIAVYCLSVFCLFALFGVVFVRLFRAMVR
jgi:hypothetical protein